MNTGVKLVSLILLFGAVSNVAYVRGVERGIDVAMCAERMDEIGLGAQNSAACQAIKGTSPPPDIFGVTG